MWIVMAILGWLLVSAVFSWGLGHVMAQANDEAGRPISRDDFDQRDALWLARAMVGEGGWTSTVDHDAIAWVLLRRWQDARTRNEDATFARVAVQYCRSLQPRTHNRRGAWLRALDRAGNQPAEWPHGTQWRLYRLRWLGVLERVDAWAAGSVPDPTGGKAMHFGSPTDPVPPGHVALPLSARNIFYEPRSR